MRLLFSALACLISVSVFGQSNKDLSFGITLGSNLSHTVDVRKYPPDIIVIAQNSKEVHNNKLGFIAGGFCKWNKTNKSFLFTEFIYTQKGSYSNDLEGSIKSNLNYLALCQSLSYKPFDIDFYIFTGFEASYLISYTSVFPDNYDISGCLDVLQYWDQYDSFEYRRFDFGMIAGLFYNLPNPNLSFSFRYTHGLMSMRPTEMPITNEVGSIIDTGKSQINLNRVLNLSIHYTFN